MSNLHFFEIYTFIMYELIQNKLILRNNYPRTSIFYLFIAWIILKYLTVYINEKMHN